MTELPYDPGVPAIRRFSGQWVFLGNFFRSLLVVEGVTYDSGEHGFNAQKTLDPEQREWVRSAPTPAEAKARGRKVTLRDGWHDHVRFRAMRQVQDAKYQGTFRVGKLLSTGRALLVEGNTWHDNDWGDCVCGRPACAEPGHNYLGKILMELRARRAGGS